jgi:hypothetical protein
VVSVLRLNIERKDLNRSGFMETLNIEDKLNADLTFVKVKGIGKAISLLIGPISEGLGKKPKKQITTEVKRFICLNKIHFIS